MKGRRRIFPSREEFEVKAAQGIASLLLGAIREEGSASLVLSGGATPAGVYRQLGSAPVGGRIDWSKVHLFWGDERCVPPSSPESNFRLVNESLLKQIAIPGGNVHRIRAERPPADAAHEYEGEIRGALALEGDQLPRFAIVLLGLGTDGHTASLFPATAGLTERGRLVTEVFVPQYEAWRITMTLPVINNAGHILFLVSGEGKAEILRKVIGEESSELPAQQVAPRSGLVEWYVDRDAASLLTKGIPQ